MRCSNFFESFTDCRGGGHKYKWRSMYSISEFDLNLDGNDDSGE